MHTPESPLRRSFLERLSSLASSLNLTLDQVLELSDSDLDEIQLNLWNRHNILERQRLDAKDPSLRHRFYELYQPSLPSTHPALTSSLPRASTSLFHSLRLHSAPLNAFLYSIQCARSPACACGFHSETVSHYLLHCPRFSRQRATLLADIHTLLPHQPLSLRLLLGNPLNLTRRQLLRVTQFVCKFVATSARFRRRRRQNR